MNEDPMAGMRDLSLGCFNSRQQEVHDVTS